MKRRLLCLLALVLSTVLAGAAAPAGTTNHPGLFGLTNLWTIHLTFTPADWQRVVARGVVQRNGGGNGHGEGPIDGLLRGLFGGSEAPRSSPAAGSASGGSSKYPWSQCVVEVAGQQFTNVAVRTKGVSSVARAPNGYKRPLKLDFNRGAKGRRLLGVEEVYLNNNVNDATQMREALAYELFRRAGLPAPRTAFAQVYLTITGRVEKQHLGLYTLVEAVEGDFLKRNFGAKDGLLLKPEMMRGLGYFGDNWGDYQERYQPKQDGQPEDAQRFIEFVRYLREPKPEEFASRLKHYLEPEPFLRFVALNAILANVDSFIGNGHNYYLFQATATRRANFIPWDLNEAFGMHPVSGPSRYQMQTSILRPNADPNQLVERCVADPVLGPKYRAICAELLTNVFVPATLSADIDRIAAVTRPVVFTETKRARADFERTVLGTLKPDEGDTSQPRFDAEYAKLSFRPWAFPDQVEIDNLPLKAWIRGRHTNALDQLAGKVKAPRSRPRLF
jgi:spore coat protein CotH